MIIGLGIDAIEVDRFEHWHTYDHKKLSKFFAPEEIDYCLSLPIKSAERFAVRFAAKEAFFKAISPLLDKPISSLLDIAHHIWIQHDDQHKPELMVDWNHFFTANQEASIKVHVSLTHAKMLAIATVILEQLS
ncbi:MAG TPA: holo-ACP synthase [Candidatus Babeliaceae bacterium]|nr:holo-ACP synthase [Candidatus Babeliaceae bacterium]